MNLPPSPASVKLLKRKRNSKGFQIIQFAKRIEEIKSEKLVNRIQAIRAIS